MSKNELYTDQEKIEIFDKLHEVVSNYIYQMNEGDLTDDGEWEEKNHLYDEVLAAFSRVGHIEDKEEIRSSYEKEIQQAMEYYGSYVNEPHVFAPSFSEILRKRQLVEELSEDRILSMEEEVMLNELDTTFRVQYVNGKLTESCYEIIRSNRTNFQWLQRVLKGLVTK